MLALDAGFKERGVSELGVGLFAVACMAFLSFGGQTSKLAISETVNRITVFFGLFVGVAAVSALSNDWIRPLAAYGALAVGALGTLYCLSDIRRIYQALGTLAWFLGVGFMGITLSSLVTAGFSTIRYEGLFNNPNSMGWFAASVGAYLVAYLTTVPRLSKLEKRFWLSLILGSVILLLASTSRKSLGGFGLAVVTALVPCIAPVIRGSWSNMRASLATRKAPVGLTVCLLIVVSLTGTVGLREPILEKNARSINATGSVIGERATSWPVMVQNLTWFGRGPAYAESIDVKLAGHNTFLSQAMRFGALPAALYASWVLYMWIRGVRNLLGGGRIGIPLLCTVNSFVFMASFSSASAAPGMWLSVVLLGLAIAEEKGWERTSRRGPSFVA
jgi:hypothetical protein